MDMAKEPLEEQEENNLGTTTLQVKTSYNPSALSTHVQKSWLPRAM